MKAHPLILMVLAAWPFSSLHASTYLSNFSGLSVNGALEGIDGWQQNAPNDNDGTYTYPLAFGSVIGSDPAAAVGGYFMTDPPSPTVEFHASHALSMLASRQLTFSMNFAINDSTGFDANGIGYGEVGFDGSGAVYGQERNSFRIGLHNAVGAEFFALVFDPVAGDPDPNVSPDDTWNISWSTGGVKTTVMGIYESQLHQLTMTFNPDGDDVDFSFSVTGSNTATTGGTLVGLADEEITELQVGISPIYSDVTLTPQFGTNHIVFNDVVAIPEPTSMILAGSGLLALLARRRRNG